MVRNPHRIWHRDPDRALALLHERAGAGELSSTDAALLSWLELVHARDLPAAERHARLALSGEGELHFASAALAEVLLRREEHEEAVHVLERARGRDGNKWWNLTIADALIERDQFDQASRLLRSCLADAELRRHALKRLARLSLRGEDPSEVRRWFGELVAIAPNYLVYASDYVKLAELQLANGERDAAHRTINEGATFYPRNAAIRKLRESEFGETEPLVRPQIEPVREADTGVHRIPIRTELISARTGLLPIIDPATRAQRQPDDVIAIAESAAASGQGRLVPLELVRPTLLARLLCRFVGKIGPLHSPEGMQGAIIECGWWRVLVAAVAGAVGKLIGRRGWFYRVAGKQAAMIDDVAACIPPFDHHIVYGPRDPDRLASELADGLGCPVAIVDANHLTGAWAVGVSPGVDRAWVERALADNPAGNEDEQTPVVILRRIDNAC